LYPISNRDKDLISALNIEDIEWQNFITKNIGELIANYQILNQINIESRISLIINHFISEMTNGNVSKFARYFGVSAMMIWNWKEGNSKPSFDYLLRYCYFFNVTMLSLLNGESIELQNIEKSALKKFNTKKRRAFDHEKIRNQLEFALKEDPPPSLTEVSNKLKYERRNLHRKFPTLCKKISAKYRSYKKNKRKTIEDELYKEVKETSIWLWQQGVYPSSEKVQEHLSDKHAFFKPIAIQARNEILEELKAKK
jgi:transcriptional regulator with XRE-family HTH domain